MAEKLQVWQKQTIFEVGQSLSLLCGSISYEMKIIKIQGSKAENEKPIPWYKRQNYMSKF